jgi:hypothetical protein
MNTTEIISMDRLPFYSDITRCPLLGSHIHNHRLCWPPDVFVENPILSYNYKNIYVQNACTFCVHVQNILCAYCTRIGQNILPAYNLYGQQSRWSFNKYVADGFASFCAKTFWRKFGRNVLSRKHFVFLSCAKHLQSSTLLASRRFCCKNIPNL